MHAADPTKSARLQRVLALMLDGRERSTLDIQTGAKVCAVNSCASELRAAGYTIHCRQEMTDTGRVWYYRMEPKVRRTDGVMDQVELLA